MVDEAHATGVLGARGAGLVEEAGLSGRVPVQMGTLGKALGSAGAYMKIFELNKDQLSDPDKIKPGQVLRLP